jgi:hypothetical protein
MNIEEIMEQIMRCMLAKMRAEVKEEMKISQARADTNIKEVIAEIRV